jgi:hypothetical protein
MYSTLLAIAISALLPLALGWVPRWAGIGRAIAPLGIAFALPITLWREGLEGGRVAGRAIAWPQALSWLGEPIFRTDALSAGLGAWCLALGGLCLLKMTADGEAPWRMALSALTVGTLYSLVHTDNLLAFAGQTLGLVMLVWAYHAWDGDAERDRVTLAYPRQLFALGLGALLLLGAVLIMGRTTGGEYSLVHMSLSALTVWPLLLLAGFVIAWLGLLPFTGWSAEGNGSAYTVLVQSLVIGIPALTILLRLETLLSAQALVGTLPGGWEAFTTTLSWLGGLTSLVAAAGMLVSASSHTARWTALLTANALGLALWGMGLDTPPGRYAAIAILLAYGAGRITYALAYDAKPGVQHGIAAASLGALPLTAGFVGIWLLGVALSELGRPTLVIALAGTVILAACGIVLHVALTPPAEDKPGRWSDYVGWGGVAAAVALVLGGALPGLWLPLVRSVASSAGGSPGITPDWLGLRAGEGVSSDLLLLLLGAAAILGLGWLIATLIRSRAKSSGTLLPTALERLEQARPNEAATPDTVRGTPLKPLLTNPPAAVWWLSLAWLDTAIAGISSLLGRLGARSGRLLSRTEGRFFLPLALILALLLVLAITR